MKRSGQETASQPNPEPDYKLESQHHNRTSRAIAEIRHSLLTKQPGSIDPWIPPINPDRLRWLAAIQRTGSVCSACGGFFDVGRFNLRGQGKGIGIMESHI